MTNFLWESVFIVMGCMVCSGCVHKLNYEKSKALSIFKVVYYTSLIASFVIVELSERGAMLFGDGYVYYTQARTIINLYGFDFSTMIDPQIFINVGQSWHFVPIWEFTLFVGLFSSTKCLALFHVILTNLAALVWTKFFDKIGMRKSGIVAATILAGSLYIRNFTIPAIKDALIYYLFTIVAYYLEEYYLMSKYKSLYKVVVPITILVFTRMYTAAALIVSIVVLVMANVVKVIKSSVPLKKFIPLIFLIATLIIFSFVSMRTAVYEYARTWVNRTELGFSLLVGIIKRVINFIYGPFITNIIEAQSLYYPSYIAAVARLAATPLLITGLMKLKKHRHRKCIYIILLLPFLISIMALSVGEQESAIRQYMNFYPLLCILYGVGYCKYESE